MIDRQEKLLNLAVLNINRAMANLALAIECNSIHQLDPKDITICWQEIIQAVPTVRFVRPVRGNMEVEDETQMSKGGISVEERIRGAKYHAPTSNEKTAEKIAMLLAESRTTFSEVDRIFQLAKDKLKVTY